MSSLLPAQRLWPVILPIFIFCSGPFSSFLSNSSLYSIDSSERTAPMASVPSIVSVKAWDGKDAEVVQEEVPLDQLFGDD